MQLFDLIRLLLALLVKSTFPEVEGFFAVNFLSSVILSRAFYSAAEGSRHNVPHSKHSLTSKVRGSRPGSLARKIKLAGSG